MTTITRLELLDAVSDATIYHAGKAITANPYVLDEEHAREVDRLKRLRALLMAVLPWKRWRDGSNAKTVVRERGVGIASR